MSQPWLATPILPPGTIVPPEVETFVVPCSWLLDDVCSNPAGAEKAYAQVRSGGMNFSKRPREQTRSNHATSKGRVGVIHRTEIIELDEAALRLEREEEYRSSDCTQMQSF